MTLPLLCLAIIGYFIFRAEWQGHKQYKDANPVLKENQAIVIPVDSIHTPNEFEKIAILYHHDQGHNVVIRDKEQSRLIGKDEKIV